MQLAAFIRANTKPIGVEWENFARSLGPVTDGMSTLALRDHVEEILMFIADDLESPQTKSEQVKKSRGDKTKETGRTAAETHAFFRQANGFNINQTISEFRALRASVIKLWGAQKPGVIIMDINDLVRFNEAIDQVLEESMNNYSEKLDQTRALFKGLLENELRDCHTEILKSAKENLKNGELDEAQAKFSSDVIESTDCANRIVSHLLKMTAAWLGSGVPVATGDEKA